MMLMRRTLNGIIFAAAAWCLAVGSPSTAQAAQNDFDLSRLADFDQKQCGDRICGTAQPNLKLFEGLVHDFGQVMAPTLTAPAETLGQAGFAVQLSPGLSFIPSDEEHWRKAIKGNTVPRSNGTVGSPTDADVGPSSALFTPQMTVRKGLPFSFEFAGTFSHIAGSDMFTVGSQLKWALNEGFYMFPDVAVRGSVNTLLGSKDLEMLTAAWDVSISKSFPIAGVLSIAPYAGYQQLHVWGWSRLLNVFPQDPRSPQQVSGGVFNPEFVFETYHTAVNRFFLGTRLNVWSVSVVPEVIIGEGVHTLSLSAGLDF